MQRESSTRRTAVLRLVGIVIAAVVGGAVVVALVQAPRSSPDVSGPPASPAPAPSEPSPASNPPGAHDYPANTAGYDVTTLPTVDVFSLARALSVDDLPGGEHLGLVATPRAPGAPLFDDPVGAPVGVLPPELTFDGTTVPVIERQESWAKIMLPGRAGLPSEGRAGQLTAWVRASDVDIVSTELSVRVSLGARSIAILDGGVVRHETGGFALGAPATPTPIGRTFIMTSRVDASAGFTRGYPVVYLGLQSPTLDGFNGASTAITAFHYHDVRDGPVSNGCLRVDAGTIEQLAALPAGTPVTISE